VTDLSAWPALVLTAGLATRLRPLSNVRAKAAMPVAGSPLVTRILLWLRSYGVRRVVLNLHHLPHTVASAVGDGRHLGLQVRYSWEREVLGSGGGIRHALPLLDAARFLVVNGDTLTDCDVAGLAAQHVTSGARVTMAVVEGDVERYGGVLVDAHGVVRGFGKPRPDTRALHFIGVQAVDAEVFQDVPDDEPLETVKQLYPQLIAREPSAVRVYESGAEFLDVGTPRDYVNTVGAIAAREGVALDVGHGCTIADDAQVERTVLWDRVSVGAGARLVDCVVADDVTVPPGATYSASVLVNGAAGLEVTPL
jgi:mannose-1-phosphate guanylyltransferase